MNAVKVSVILPVYNPGEGVIKCIKSLQNQTLKDIEMIFVDDHGTDDSIDKIMAAAASDSRIRILTYSKNMGPGFARNAGIEASRGEYLSFIDPDDYVAEDFYELLYKKAKEGDYDIVKGQINYVLEDGTPFPRENINDHIRANLKKGKPLYLCFNYQHQSAIYRRQMVMESGARYGLARRAQDNTFLLKACNGAATFETEDPAIYYFCERGTSTMHTIKVNTLLDLAFSFKEQVDYVSTHLASDPWAIQYISILVHTNMRFSMRYEGVQEYEPILKIFVKKTKKQLLRLPFYDELKEQSFPIRVMVEKGTVLPIIPGLLPWEHSNIHKWSALIKRWVDFMSANPSYSQCHKAEKWLCTLCFKMEETGKEEGKENEAHRMIRELIHPLSLSSKLNLLYYYLLYTAAKYAPRWVHDLRLKMTRK